MYQPHTNPILNDLLVKERHTVYRRQIETGRLCSLVSGTPRRNRTPIGRTRHVLGATLILVVTWLQGIRRQALPTLEAPTPATPSLL